MQYTTEHTNGNADPIMQCSHFDYQYVTFFLYFSVLVVFILMCLK